MFGWQPEDFPAATALWERSLSLPIFSRMTDEQVEHVIDSVKLLCARHSQRGSATARRRGEKAANPRVA